jgi:hypothetical protein
MANTTNTAELKQRKALIASIAMRHRAENDLIKNVSVETKDSDDSYTKIVEEEFAVLQKHSINDLSFL